MQITITRGRTRPIHTRIIASLGALALATSLTACGGGGGGSPAAIPSGGTPAPAASEKVLTSFRTGNREHIGRLDLESGVMTRITGTGMQGIRDVGGICYDADRDAYVVADESLGALVALDATTGVRTILMDMRAEYLSAVAYDAATRTYFVIDTDTGTLWRLDPSDGSQTQVATLVNGEIEGLAMGPDGLYGLDDRNGRLVRIDPSTGAETDVGATGSLSNPMGLAYDATRDVLYAVSETALHTIDRGTAATSQVAAVGREDLEGLTYHPGSDSLVALATYPESFGTLDRTTGAYAETARLSWNDGAPTCSPTSGLLYSIDSADHMLLRAYPDTGAIEAVMQGPEVQIVVAAVAPGDATVWAMDTTGVLYALDLTTQTFDTVGNTGRSGRGGMVYDAGRGVLQFADSSSDMLYRIDTDTAVATPVGPLAFGSPNGLAMDPTSGTLWASDSAQLTILEIDPETVAMQIVMDALLSRINGITYDALESRLIVATGSDQLAFIDIAAQSTHLPHTLGGEGLVGMVDKDDGSITVLTHNRALGILDPLTGEVTLGQRLSFEGAGLALNPATGTLTIAEGRGDREFGTLDRTTFALARTGSSHATEIAGLAWDTNRGRLVGVTGPTGEAVEVASRGSTTPWITLGFNSRAIAFDATRDAFFAIDGTTDVLMAIDANTGAVTTVGPLGTEIIAGGMAFDTLNDRIVAMSFTNSEVFAIDPDTGVATPLGDIAPYRPHGATYDAVANQFLATTTEGQVVTVDLTGAPVATLVGQVGLRTPGGLVKHPTAGGLVTYDARSGAVLEVDESAGTLRLLGVSTLDERGGTVAIPGRDELLVLIGGEGLHRVALMDGHTVATGLAQDGAAALSWSADRGALLGIDETLEAFVWVDPNSGTASAPLPFVAPWTIRILGPIQR